MARCLVPITTLTAVVLACSGQVAGTPAPPQPDASVDASSAGVDTSAIVVGIPDGGRDPAVVAIDLDGQGYCTGTLIATNVVLTARHCVSVTNGAVVCPTQGSQIASDLAPATLGILVGDDVQSAQLVAHGAEVVMLLTGEICDHDIAAIILDTNVDIAPVKVSTTNPTAGLSVRTIGFAADAEDAGAPEEKLLREYMKVVAVSPTELEVGEAACAGDSGGPALDESGSELVGVVSRGGSSCEGLDVHNVYTRVDVYAGLIQAALEEGKTVNAAAGITPPKPTSAKLATDVGGPCTQASDCSTGVCVTMNGADYCSRTCGTGDRCSAGFHCTALSGTKVCTET
jgi:hypothetical protein